MNKPFETYNGGKGADGTYQKIINRIPPHVLYIEVCLGNGTIFRKKRQSKYAIGIDLDPSVIEAWRKLNLPGITVINDDGIRWLKNMVVLADIFKNAGIVPFIYIDPPYPKSARKNQKDLYGHEMTDADHISLLSVVRSLPFNTMISSYPNNMYDLALKSWTRETFQSKTRNGMATEVLYYNYPKPSELHDYQYLGETYRERERIKGIVYRNASKIRKMPVLERNWLIKELSGL